MLCFGPSKQAARLEGSKAFSKDFMVRHGIDTAAHRSFTDFDAACAYVTDEVAGKHRVVVKASGLAAGKGVLLPETTAEAIAALRTVMVDKAFGAAAGAEVVVEEFMEGPEVSVFAFCDGKRVHLLPASQDHKRALDGDLGPNTGGMGAYCPAPVLTPAMEEHVRVDVVQRTIDGAKKEGFPFVGLLYTGLMLTATGPRVLEYNCRFGDPETQAVLLLLRSDLFAVMRACAKGDLPSAGPLLVKTDCAAATVVAAAGGYPGKYGKGEVITGVDDANAIAGVHVFQAGTKQLDDGSLVTSGGRVLVVSASAPTLGEALMLAYAGMKKISFQGMQFRSDIGYQALAKGGSGSGSGRTAAKGGADGPAAFDVTTAMLIAAGAIVVGIALMRILAQ